MNPTPVMDDFLTETTEMLDRAAAQLTLVEKSRHTDQTLNSLYRDFHTIKGTAQLFGCNQISQLAHSLESTLDFIRTSPARPDRDIVDLLFRGIDLIRKQIQSLRSQGVEADMTQELMSLVPALADATTQLVDGSSLILKEGPLIETTEAENVQPPAPAATPLPAAPKKADETVAVDLRHASETVRVPVDLLDKLMNLAGELVIIRNQVVQYKSESADDADFTNLAQRLNIVTTELQNEVMKTRMQPIGGILLKFHRIVRDLSQELGKEIELKLEGTETELDKTLIEAVKDPLTHIVRNSIDHGIETPQEREALQKPAQGHILIRSYHEGGQIVIEIRDDGRGLSRDKIATKAIEKGLISAEKARKMTDREVQSLIFTAGFSTAQKVSNISGRGVGMDVVRTNIEKIGGIVDLSSEEAVGMTVKIKIPLTLAIVPALIVWAGTERFAIPQIKLTELVRVEQGKEGQLIQMLQGQPVINLRGSLLPLLSLRKILNLGDRLPDAKSDGSTYITVLRVDTGLFGLIVDGIEDSTDIVVKPLSGFLKNVPIYSGATVLGDGTIALVLDVVGLASAGSLLMPSSQTETQDDPSTAREIKASTTTEYLVIDIGTGGTYTIPLCLVHRLEEFKRSTIEYSGQQTVVRYRDSILPVVSIADRMGLERKAQTTTPDDIVPVVVVEHGKRLYGLQVDAIMDIVGIDSEVDTAIKDRPCILGTTFLGGHIVVVINAFEVIDSAYPPVATAGRNRRRSTADRASKKHILFVDDNNFFRNQIQHVLLDAGYAVTVASDGEEAFHILDAADDTEFAAVLSDLEMPDLDGMQLAGKIRGLARYATLPLVVMTSKTGPLVERQCQQAGFDFYIDKAQAFQLVEIMQEALEPRDKDKKYGT